MSVEFCQFCSFVRFVPQCCVVVGSFCFDVYCLFLFLDLSFISVSLIFLVVRFACPFALFCRVLVVFCRFHVVSFVRLPVMSSSVVLLSLDLALSFKVCFCLLSSLSYQFG